MKKLCVFLAATMLLLSMNGCAVLGGSMPPVPDVFGEEMKAVYDNRETALPVAVVYVFQGNGFRTGSPAYGADAVNAVLDAFLTLEVESKTEIMVADSDTTYRFIGADGGEVGSICFNGSNLEVGDARYVVDTSGIKLSSLFPSVGRHDDLALNSPDAALREFMQRQSGDAPVALRVKSSVLGEYEITDAEKLGDITDALYAIELSFAEPGVEPAVTTRELTFVMADGTEYALRFCDNMYVYEFPAPLGTWSYWLDSAEYLFEQLDACAK